MSEFKEQLRKLMGEHPELFPTEAKFWQYLRGCLRRGLWERSPLKHKFKQSKMESPPEGYLGRGKKGAECALTGEWTMTSKLEVDHKTGHQSLLKEEDVLPYVIHLLSCGDQLQLAEKEAHKIKSYAERKGLSFEEAKAVKKAIAFSKLPVSAQKEVFKEMGVDSPSSNLKRREAFLEALRQDIV